MSTVRKIANHVNLSPATVSRALRGFEGVSSETLNKVQEAAVELGYHRGRRSKAKRTVALVVTTQADGEPFELARRNILVISQELARRGWQSYPVMVPGVGSAGEKILTDFIEGRGTNGVNVDGCLMIGRLSSDLLPRYHHFLAERFVGNIVMLCYHDVANGLSGVAMMDYDAGIHATEILINEGHTKIGWIGSLGSKNNAAERLGGVHTALRNAGATLAHEIWMNDRSQLPNAEVRRIMREKLPADRTEWPTAWVCSTDWLAAKLIVWARSEGLEVPSDMSVVAFDNTQMAEHLAETIITSVVFDYEGIARKSVELLEQHFESKDKELIVWSLPHRVRRGETVAVPKGTRQNRVRRGKITER